MCDMISKKSDQFFSLKKTHEIEKSFYTINLKDSYLNRVTQCCV